MFCATLLKWRKTLALQLTLLYAAIFTVSITLAFAFVYFLVVSIITERTDDDLQDDIAEFAEFIQQGGLERVQEEIALETSGEDNESVFFRLWSAKKTLLASSDMSAWTIPDMPPAQVWQHRPSGDIYLAKLDTKQDGHKVRIAFAAIAPDIFLEIGQSLADDETLSNTLLQGFLVALAAAFLLGGPIGGVLAVRALRGVKEVTQTANEITHGDLNRRVVPHRQNAELYELAEAFNAMLDQMQSLIISMREMGDNLAHDLRSPLGRIRAAAESAINHIDSPAEVESMIACTIEECDHLMEMINITLDIAETESGTALYQFDNIDLSAVVRDAVELFQPVADDKSIVLETDLPDQCHIYLDRSRLQRVVANLLDNALKYTQRQGRVTIRLTSTSERVEISFKDNGIGIASDDIARVFDRFYRCERSRNSKGNGLGLSLAMTIVRAHGGDIQISSTPGKGSSFVVVLPRRCS